MADVPTPREQLAILGRGAVDLVRPEELLAKLERGQPLKVKLGCDPSAPDIHLGHLVVLRKLKAFQDLGHEVLFVVGDFTAQIGDPSGRSKTRPALTADAIRDNAESYRNQVGMVLDPLRTRLVYNSTWLDALGSRGWVQLAGKTTVARMLERDDFAKRHSAGLPISLHEFLYPLAQAYDSVALHADVEIGGTDQTFNLLMGRDLQREHGQEPQVILTMPLLVGLDGKDKMSKSLGNYVAITDPPTDMYGKLMSASDELMWTYLEILGEPAIDIAALQRSVADGSAHPMQIKKDFARGMVANFHGATQAAEAEREFERVFRDRARPTAIEQQEIASQPEPVAIVRLLVSIGLAPSTSEARRLVEGGAVILDGERVTAASATVDAHPGRTCEFKVGKRRFARVRFV